VWYLKQSVTDHFLGMSTHERVLTLVLALRKAISPGDKNGFGLRPRTCANFQRVYASDERMEEYWLLGFGRLRKGKLLAILYVLHDYGPIARTVVAFFLHHLTNRNKYECCFCNGGFFVLFLFIDFDNQPFFSGYRHRYWRRCRCYWRYNCRFRYRAILC
jgi:hypothetical protein